MTDGIQRVGSGSTSGVGGGYFPNNRGNDLEQNEEQQVQPQVEFKPVDENKVWEFLNTNSYFVASLKGSEALTEENGFSSTMKERIEEEYMPNFMLAFSIIEGEFGEEVAMELMQNDAFMNKLIDLFNK